MCFRSPDCHQPCGYGDDGLVAAARLLGLGPFLMLPRKPWSGPRALMNGSVGWPIKNPNARALTYADSLNMATNLRTVGVVLRTQLSSASFWFSTCSMVSPTIMRYEPTWSLSMLPYPAKVPLENFRHRKEFLRPGGEGKHSLPMLWVLPPACLWNGVSRNTRPPISRSRIPMRRWSTMSAHLPLNLIP